MKIDEPIQSQNTALRNLWREAFGDSEVFLDSFFSTAFREERCRSVTIDGNVASALYWFDCFLNGERIAYVYAVATAKAYRGQGICHKLIENTHLHLKNLDYGGVILVPGSDGLFEFYKRMGYLIFSHIREFCCSADTADKKMQISKIGKTEYAKLRREFLPDSGVVQENENIDFLQTQADFYTGDGFLLAAREEDGDLFGVELLGDSTVAEKIVYALGYENGKFRIPAKDCPFSMYYPLGDSKIPEDGYFGLAFD